MKSLFIIYFLIMMAVNTVLAEDVPVYNLEQCIEMVIENNVQTVKAAYDYKSSLESTRLGLSEYDISLAGSLGYTDAQSSGADPLMGTSTNMSMASIVARKKFYLSGGVLSLEWEDEKTDSDSIFVSMFGAPNPSYEAKLSLAYSQPLLNNSLGINEKRKVEMSRLNEEIARLKLKNTEHILINRVEKAYFSLGLEKESLNTQKESLERSKKLLKINRQKFRDGLIEEVDIIATEAAITLREAAVLVAESRVENARDDLKKLVGIDVKEKCLFLFGLPEEFVHQQIGEEELIVKALRQRPDIKLMENIIRVSSLDLKIKRNQKFPDLSLISSYGLTSTEDSWAGSYESLSSIDNPQWYLGLELSLFPQNRMAGSLMKLSEYAKRKYEADYEDKKSAVIIECRRIARSLNTKAQYVQAARKTIGLQGKKLHLEEIKFNQGRSTIKWILQYQDDLSNAQIEYKTALIDYYKAQSDLKLITGEYR